MSDKFVTVMTFNQSFEAQLAKNLLDNEGIESILAGEQMSDLQFGNSAMGDQIVLQVREDDAQRAAGILAVVAAAKLDDDWEKQTTSGVWVCSLCGEPISNHLSVCYSCQTPRESIRTSVPRDRTAIQPDLATLPMGDEVQKRDDIADAPASLTSSPLTPVMSEPEEIDKSSPTGAGDDLARRACIASLFFVLMPVSWYYLLRLGLFSGELSPKGIRYFYAALTINGLFVLAAIVVAYAGRFLLL